MEVREKRIVHSAEGLGPRTISELAVDADTQDLGVAGFELTFELFDAWDFDASSWGESERVKDEQNFLLACEVRQTHARAEVAVEFELRGDGAGCNHCHVYFPCGRDLPGWAMLTEDARPTRWRLPCAHSSFSQFVAVLV